MNNILWQPNGGDITQSNLYQFMQYVNNTYNLKINDYPALHAWSIQAPADFWESLWKTSDILAHSQPTRIRSANTPINNTKWFEGATLNFAQNLLNQAGDSMAIHYQREDGLQMHFTYEQLRHSVNRLQQHLIKQGLSAGDCVAGLLSNSPDAIIAMLASVSLGASWSSCSPELGIASCLDRLKQIQPDFIFAQQQHHYNGKLFDHSDKIHALQQQLTPKQWILFCQEDTTDTLQPVKSSVYYDDLPTPDDPLHFIPLPFDHPLYILFTSGTTGTPKCLVHGAGGTLLQHIKEHRLHTNIAPGDTLFFYTTTSWMMWNWLVSGLASGATLVLYDGSPTYPHPFRLLELIDLYQIQYFGIGAKLVEHWQHQPTLPKKQYHFQSLQSVLTTGSPLLPTAFDYLNNAIKSTIPVCSISGGTDIVSCFALGNPMLPVHRGQLQCRGLGMDVNVFNEKGQAIYEQEGELVCCNSFPSMPLYFLNDPEGKRYHNAYFSAYKNTWTHGDFAIQHNHGGMTILGRSDTTLNPGGIRIGTAEIYRELSQLTEIVESIAVGKTTAGDELIVLLVVLAPRHTLDSSFIQTIKSTIRQGATPHHVPQYIFQVKDLPRTISGKLSEKAVKNALHHRDINNQNALANPECLKEIQSVATELQLQLQ